ncbi:MAG: glycosyltransferase [Candidatus Woesearchaeota archaeon]|nr:glycosyltransferase [Candidatus Woesearchaeota archaeon]
MKGKNIFGVVNEILQSLYSVFHKDFVSVIIPAYNEEKTIRKVIETVKKSKVNEIIIVDDGSKDKTYEKAKLSGVKVIKHKRNVGKGMAMRTGVENAKGNIIVFVDADIESLTPQKVNMLIDPILKNEADFVKSYFSQYKSKTGTSIFLYKPLLKHLFSATGFTHPVSGQIAARKRFFGRIEFRNDYGIDISILVDAVKRNLRIKEVCLGELKHRKRTVHDVEKIADTVIATILEKAGVIREKGG